MWELFVNHWNKGLQQDFLVQRLICTKSYLQHSTVFSLPLMVIYAPGVLNSVKYSYSQMQMQQFCGVY